MIGSVLVAGAVLASGATAAFAQTGPTLGPYGYGDVKLGMTAKQAKATGAVVEKNGDSSGEGPCSGWDLKKFPTGKDYVGIYISKKYGVVLIAAGKGVKTPEGIRIGSTGKQLKAAYPHIKKDVHGFYDIKVPGNKKAYYSFTVEHAKVTDFNIVANNQDCFN
ncbi:hypothetical protein [Nonomuraea sediminis]|uniref:hypothetical protein n=1 Tax=Nonomuraea sediminis TaxID=2835864 RepID=UPI001BDD42EC|nr:hypothetical protein [Nonomuraea sediminis]